MKVRGRIDALAVEAGENRGRGRSVETFVVKTDSNFQIATPAVPRERLLQYRRESQLGWTLGPLLSIGKRNAHQSRKEKDRKKNAGAVRIKRQAPARAVSAAVYDFPKI
jgi:hypothetical protein